MTAETVEIATPAFCATSRIVDMARILAFGIGG